VLANIGIIAGIFFLAFELRQNNALMQSEASIAYVDMRRSSYRDLAEDPRILSIVDKAARGEELTAVESMSIDFLNKSVFVTWEWEYDQYVEGILDVLDQAPADRWRPTFNAIPSMRKTWSTHKESASADFVQYVEDNLLD